MTIFDYLVIFVMVTSVIISLLRGLVKEVLSLAGWVVAFVVANAYAAALAVMLPAVVPGAVLRLFLAFVALFIGVRILMGLLSMALGALLDAGGLSLFDRALGAVFGVGRGLVIVLTAVILCGMTSLPQQDFWKDALFSPFAESGARIVKTFLPAAMAQHVNF
ncbi:membrane protein required for colicin V production [Duganella sp. 1411]|uniref:CvpA family protein n=1 Tax=Duganella sp. 1411 TaxID=2806572 RepID=UPI001AE18AB5|nr:membrane protein required for colicin V production [Duganella sp. 1411]